MFSGGVPGTGDGICGQRHYVSVDHHAKFCNAIGANIGISCQPEKQGRVLRPSEQRTCDQRQHARIDRAWWPGSEANWTAGDNGWRGKE